MRSRVAVNTGFALCVSPSSRDLQTSAADPEGCAAARGPREIAVVGCGFRGVGDAPNVPDRGGVLEEGACPLLLKMLRLPRLRYVRPPDARAAAASVAELGARAMLVAGGTDLFP